MPKLAAAFLTVTRSSRGKDPETEQSPPGRIPPVIAIRVLHAATFMAWLVELARALARHLWRERHQDRALIGYYRSRGDPPPQDLGM